MLYWMAVFVVHYNNWSYARRRAQTALRSAVGGRNNNNKNNTTTTTTTTTTTNNNNNNKLNNTIIVSVFVIDINIMN